MLSRRSIVTYEPKDHMHTDFSVPRSKRLQDDDGSLLPRGLPQARKIGLMH